MTKAREIYYGILLGFSCSNSMILFGKSSKQSIGGNEKEFDKEIWWTLDKDLRQILNFKFIWLNFFKLCRVCIFIALSSLNGFLKEKWSFTSYITDTNRTLILLQRINLWLSIPVILFTTIFKSVSCCLIRSSFNRYIFGGHVPSFQFW